MANCTSGRYYYGIATTCGDRTVSSQSYTNANVTTFGHYSGNAAQALVGVSMYYEFRYWAISWINPNTTMAWGWVANSSVGFQKQITATYYKNTACEAYQVRSQNMTPSVRISSSDTQIGVTGWLDYDYSWPTTWQAVQNDGSSCQVYLPLDTNHRILPPKGIAAQISHFTQTTLDCSSSITSWSDNPKIVGTPYTQGGGRTWNFMAEIKTAQSTSSTTLKRIEKNTGETKNATFNFTGLDLAQGTTYYVRYVVSNDYQQIIETWNSFTTPKVGPLTLTIDSYNTREVRFTASVPSIESTEATWTFKLKDVNNVVMATKSVTNADTTQNNFFKNVELKLGKDYFIEAECKNKEGFSASASATFHMWLGWVVWSNGTKKRIGRMTQTTTSGTKEIIKMSTRGGGTGPITAYEYDELEYSAIDYDNKNMTAEDYDTNAKAYLT